MALIDEKISELVELDEAPAAGDFFPIVDISAAPATTKKITPVNAVDNNAKVLANTAHITSDGKDHSDVVLNNTHRSSDGKDHSDVVLNNTHRVTFRNQIYYAENLRGTDNADFAISAEATPVVDSNNNAVNVRAFDATLEEGVSFKELIPSGATNIKFTFMSRAEIAPGSAKTVKLNFYEREIPDNAAITAWSSAIALSDVSIPTNENFQLDTQTIALATLGLAVGQTHQIIISREPVGDDLVGDWDLLSWQVEYT